MRFWLLGNRCDKGFGGDNERTGVSLFSIVGVLWISALQRGVWFPEGRALIPNGVVDGRDIPLEAIEAALPVGVVGRCDGELDVVLRRWRDVDGLVLSLLVELGVPFGRVLTSTVRMGDCVFKASGPFLCSRPGSDLILTSCLAFEGGPLLLEDTGS